MENHSEARSTWRGSTLAGSGTVSTASRSLEDSELTWRARIGESAGSNPEELVAAAHAGCYGMALSFALSTAGHEPEELRTHARVTFTDASGSPTVTAVHLTVDGDVPGIDEATFREFAEQAAAGCPISRLMAGNVELTHEARLLSAA